MKKVLLAVFVFVYGSIEAHAGQIVATTSDYESANTAVYDTDTHDFISAALGQDDQDIVVDTDGEYVYFISRTLGSVAKYNPFALGTEPATDLLVWQYSVGPGSNPYDIVFLDSKAYVIRCESSEILIIDQNAESQAAFELGAIDLSAFDEHGLPEAVYGFEYNGMVYVVLQRLNNWAAEIPGYLVKIDPSTDTVVDLDPDTDGVQGIELLVKNPLQCSQAGSMAYISGHDWAGQTEGVQSIDLADPDLGQTLILDEEALFMDITGAKAFDQETGVFYSSSWAQDGDEWIQIAAAYWFDPQTGEVGEALPVPTPDGGAVKVDDIVYMGSRDDETPGIYPVDPATNTLAGEALLTTLPLLSMVYAEPNPVTAVSEPQDEPSVFALDAPYPNPFNPSTTITFSLPDAGMTRIDVFNLAGQHIETIAHGLFSAGSHSVVWHAGDMANGVYFMRVRHGDAEQTARVMLIK